ncbi:hypothetical protein [Enterobacter roggenkampii]|uniref:hypothetical protein n=1 Tax=Enterobacter roggenkampii TaxID=1812935 RepID=UPI00336B3E52
MSEQKPVGVIENFEIGTDTSNLNSLGAEVTAMKVAIGLLFQKMPSHHRDAFLMELRQLDNPWMNGLAKQLEQFKI